MSDYARRIITAAKISQFMKSPGLSTIELLERMGGKMPIGRLYNARGSNGRRELLTEALKYLLEVGVIDIIEEKTRTRSGAWVKLIGSKEKIDSAKEVFRVANNYIKTIP